ncbi:MAG: ABC transporter permease [Dehalococcoidia bacterium]|nr:ABC transporter permease [Dehalococcoidia bacterium]
MTELFGVPIERVMYGVLVLLGLCLATLAVIAWRQPVLVRMGLRNIGRRPGQTALIVLGLMLSTLIMSAAFATGDTVGYSIAGQIYNNLRETDITLHYDSGRGQDSGRDQDSGTGQPDGPQLLVDSDLERLQRDLGANPDIDGISGQLEVAAPAVLRAHRLSEPQARLLGIDPATASGFSWLRADGEVLSVSGLRAGEAFVTRTLARSLDARAGDTVTVFLEGTAHDFVVARVIEDVGLNDFTQGRASGGGGGGGGKVVARLETVREISGRPGFSSIAISVTGGVRDTAERSEAVERQVEAYLASSGVPARADLSKRALVNIANLVGSAFVSFFVLFGLFSIAAGVLLIFLIFVMLAAERRTEMGIARAVGMRRGHVTQAFIAEGMTYNLGAAALGAGLGVGVAYLLVATLRSIVADEVNLQIAFNVNPAGVVIAYGLGVVLTFGTVAYSSWRASSLNIVRAIRDLPEPNPLRPSRASLPGLVQAALGALLLLGWLALGATWVAAGIALFIASLGFYGLGAVLGLPLAAWFVLSIRAAEQGFAQTRGWRRGAYLVWWVGFFPLSLATWFLVRTRAWAARHRNGGGWALVLLLGGLGAVYVGGWVWGQAFAYQSGVTLVVLAVAMLGVYFGVPGRPAFTVAGLALVWYWLLPLPFTLFLEDAEGWTDPLRAALEAVGGPMPLPIAASIEMFFVSGICITAAATLVVVFNASWFLRVVALLGRVASGLTPAVRTAIAYPLAAKFRTGMTLAMFGLVVFSLVVMASLNYNFTQLFLGADAGAGFDVVVQSNEANRLDDLRAELEAADPGVLAEVTAIGRISTARAEASVDPSAGVSGMLALTGADDGFLGATNLTMLGRARGYASDAAVLEALRTDPTTAIVHASYVGAMGPPRGGGAPARFGLVGEAARYIEQPWEPIPVTVRDPATGATSALRVIAILDAQQASVLEGMAALVTSDRTTRHLISGRGATSHVLGVRGGDTAALEVARRVESALYERGIQAESIPESVRRASEQALSFQLLFEGFMGLGLIVGIAALGVIAFRTVVERRQQIGMLRAIGYSRRLVALSFFLESSFIAGTGIAMGIVLGVALSYNLLTGPAFAASTDIVFRVPWMRLGVIAGIAYGASALMTLLPARAASRVPVAAALRYE